MWVVICPYPYCFACIVPDILFDVMDNAVRNPADHVACAAFPLVKAVQDKWLLACMRVVGVAPCPRLGYVIGHATYGPPGIVFFGNPVRPTGLVCVVDKAVV
jgi:hypothetical protein